MSDSNNKSSNVIEINKAEGWDGAGNFMRRHKKAVAAGATLLALAGIGKTKLSETQPPEAPIINMHQPHREVVVKEGDTLSSILVEAIPVTDDKNKQAIYNKRAQVAAEIANTLYGVGTDPRFIQLPLGAEVPLPEDAAIGRQIEPPQ